MLSIRALRTLYKYLLARLFHLGQHLGFDVLPRHFYSEIPNISKLRATDHWRKPYSMTGVAGADIDNQLRFVQTTISDSLLDAARGGDVYTAACDTNGEPGYGPIEADFLFAFVAAHRPGRITQIGCGVSTALCIAAAEHAGYQPQITCIEPYPTAFLSQAAADGRITLIPKPVESLDLDFVADLKTNDLFFVDSSHTLGPSGEVSRIILEMLPRLADGVFVHFHDIWFPYDYPPHILDSELFFTHESTLLHGLLTHNHRFSILASLSMLHYDKRADLQRLFNSYAPRKDSFGLCLSPGHFPTSIFLLCSDNRASHS